MRHFPLLLICGALVTACDEQVTDPLLLPPPPPPPPGFLVTGIVETEEGFPLPGADAEIIKAGGSPVLSAVTDSTGRFVFGSVSGPVTLRVSKSGFTREARYLVVTESVTYRIRLARLLPDGVLTLGDTITATVQEGAPPCDPGGWDANAPCHRFHFIAPASGKLLVAITWQGSPELDATLVVGRGGYVGSSVTAGFERALLEADVVKGTDYELRINSYYGKQDFKLIAQLIH